MSKTGQAFLQTTGVLLCTSVFCFHCGSFEFSKYTSLFFRPVKALLLEKGLVKACLSVRLFKRERPACSSKPKSPELD